MRAFRRFTVRPVLPEPLGALAVLAGNLRWSWHPPTQDVFSSIDPQVWRDVAGDPVRFRNIWVREIKELKGKPPEPKKGAERKKGAESNVK